METADGVECISASPQDSLSSGANTATMVVAVFAFVSVGGLVGAAMYTKMTNKKQRTSASPAIELQKARTMTTSKRDYVAGADHL